MMSWEEAMNSVNTETLLRKRAIYKIQLEKEKEKVRPNLGIIKDLEIRIGILEKISNRRGTR